MIRLKEDRYRELLGGMSECAFAEMLGVSRLQIWRIRTGKTSAGEKFLEKFMLCFPDKSINDYFYVQETKLEHIPDPRPTMTPDRREQMRGTFFAAPVTERRGRAGKRGDAT